MTAEDLAKKLAEEAKITPEEAAQFIESFGKVLLGYFAKGEKVIIAEFGSFYVAADGSVQFNPSTKLKESIG